MSPEIVNLDPDFKKDQIGFDISKTCIHCRKETIYKLSEDQYYKWVVQNNYIQDVFPHLSAQQREQMISGTHPHCWDEMFPEDFDED
jgi:hypothetical protein